MRIPRQLHQFRDETALVIVAAKQEGRVYRARNGEIELIEEFRTPTPKFSDNEGLSEERGRRENNAELMIKRDYLEHFEKLFRSIAPIPKPTNVYIFAPAHMAGEVEGIIKPIFGALPVKTVTGIFTKESPTEFLERIYK